MADETSTKQRNKAQRKEQKNRDKVAQIAAETVERVERETDVQEEIIVTIEELPPGQATTLPTLALPRYRGVNPAVPVSGMFDLASVPVTLMRATFDFWGTIMGSVIDYQKNTMTRMFDQTVDTSKELVQQAS